MQDRPRLIQVDSRRRISLGWTKLVADFYTVTVESDGTIILTPVQMSKVGVTVDPEAEDE